MVITYEAKSYSKGRSTVMGIATLLIIWFHSCVGTPAGSLLWLQKSTSDIGVDMFLFASGMGVYFAWKKYRRFLPYIVSRMQRVLVPYLLVAVPWFAYQDIIIGHSRRLFVKDVTMLTFWTEGRMTFWFVSAILILYILTPIYIYHAMREKRNFLRLDVLLTVLIWGAVVLVPSDVLRAKIGPAMIFLPRIPVYLMGLSFGKAIEEGKVFRVHLEVLVGILAVCGFIAAGAWGYFPWKLPTEWKYVAFGPMAVILSCAFARIPENKLTNYFGKRSLECYFLLEKVQVTLGEFPQMEPLMSFSAIPFFLLCFLVTLILVELLRCLSYPFQRPIPWKRLDKHGTPQ